MVFKRKDWQKRARSVLSRSRQWSYGKLADVLKCSKSTVWNILNRAKTNITIEDMLLISRILDINPLDYIVRDEVQLELL